MADELRRIVERMRLYAPIREGGTKQQKELGALRDLLESMARGGDSPYLDPRVWQDDPPDCIAETTCGALVAFEVTEFVSQEAIALSEKARPGRKAAPKNDRMVYRGWDRAGFLERIAAILKEKDSKTFKGGPYAEMVVLIHTDEPLLLRHDCESWLSDRQFGPFQRLTSAYFLCPYEPHVGYPFVRVRFGGVQPASADSRQGRKL